MRILIVGGSGMLGHRLYQDFSKRHEVRITLRNEFAAYANSQVFQEQHTYTKVPLDNVATLLEIFQKFKPDAVINAAGIVKQRQEAKEVLTSLEINSLLPHRLAWLCQQFDARLIQMSTDCIFSGKKGGYTELDYPDAEDIYGKSKLLGEVVAKNCMTLRTSIIGTELYNKMGLIEWFLAQRGEIKGYTRAIYSGFTTIEMGRIIERLLSQNKLTSGIINVSSDPINKYDLLKIIRDKLNLPVTIIPDGSLLCDRSLDSKSFRSLFDYTPPSWDRMIDELADTIRTTR